MAFESLTEKLQNVFKNLRSKGRLTEADVKTALKEVKMALLEADVSFKVVKQFIKSVQEQAVGQDVMNGLNPGQMVIKIVNDELVKLMGSETTEIALRPASEVTIIMMAGLQGAGKTTTTAKIAGKLKAKGRKPLLAACDVYRPAAIKQLQVNGEKQGVEVFAMGDKNRPVDIAKAALVHAKTNGFNVLILDTAGRLHIDEEMMQELQDIKAAVPVDQTLLVVDAMTGQDAVNVAEMFSNKVGIDGVVLTKLDGDTRGGAALSAKKVTGKPINTLVSFKTHKIPQSTVDALEQAKKNGVEVYISTGRPQLLITNLGQIEHLIDGYITTNGARCFVGDKVVSQHAILPEDVKKIIEELE